MRYLGGQISPDQVPKLQILEGGSARLQRKGESTVATLEKQLAHELFSQARNPKFLSLDSTTLDETTKDLLRKQGGPIPRIMDASRPSIRVWTGQEFHEVSFYAPRQYLRLSGENPDLALFVELLEELEAVMSQFPKG